MTSPTAYGRRGPALLPSFAAAYGGSYANQDAGVEDAIKPFVLGYIDAAQLPDEDAITQTRARIGQYAVDAGLQMGSIYVDRPGDGGSMFRSLLASIERYNPAHVLVPSLNHVAPLGRPGAETKQQYIENRTPATIRVVDSLS